MQRRKRTFYNPDRQGITKNRDNCSKEKNTTNHEEFERTRDTKLTKEEKNAEPAEDAEDIEDPIKKPGIQEMILRIFRQD
jgi:hypothetical protein